MGNIILLKHGSIGKDGKLPNNALQPYEPGYCNNGQLYIGIEGGYYLYGFIDPNEDGNIIFGKTFLYENNTGETD